MSTLVKYNPVLDHFFNGFLGDTNGGYSKSKFVPQVEASENEKEFIVDLFVPGLKKEDFKISIDEQKLTITGDRKKEEKDGVKYHIREVVYGNFSRTFNLPKNIDAKEISATYLDGVLSVNIPKDEAKALRQVIEVK